MSEISFIYVIGQVRNRRVCGPIKIGVSKSPTNRLDQLQTGSPQQLVLVHSFRCSSAEAEAFERRVHDLFPKSRMRGEWFDINPIDAAVAIATVIEGEECDARRFLRRLSGLEEQE